MDIETRLKLIDEQLEQSIKFHQQNQNDPHGISNAVIAALSEVKGAIKSAQLEPVIQFDSCPSCQGSGQWEAACCNGAFGCSCRGDVIPMGRCNVCNGTGSVRADGSGVDTMANVKTIEGLCYIGSGPR